jgi:hypothetical protein
MRLLLVQKTAYLILFNAVEKIFLSLFTLTMSAYTFVTKIAGKILALFPA